MIRSNKGKVRMRGLKSEILADLTLIIKVLIVGLDIPEELIDLAIDEGKKNAKKEKNKKNDSYKNITINITELLKQLKEKGDK